MLRQATPNDLETLKTHLQQEKLVLQGIEEHLEHFWLLFDNENLVASAGLEMYGSVALLRSVAVNEKSRGLGLGKQIIKKVIEYASSLGVQELVLLTKTAPNYFKRYGFAPMTRENTPEAVKASVEFKGACSDKAIIMHSFLLS
jgi:amino-acid N-acetyltransferase